MAWKACLPIVVGAVLLLLFTKGHLSSQPDRTLQRVEAPRSAEAPLANVPRGGVEARLQESRLHTTTSMTLSGSV